jgi:hypothetical protein
MTYAPMLGLRILVRALVTGRSIKDVARGEVRQNRIGRMAGRQGYVLRKSRRRHRRALNYEIYWLVDPESNRMVAGDVHGWSLNDVEEWLTSD